MIPKTRSTHSLLILKLVTKTDCMDNAIGKTLKCNITSKCYHISFYYQYIQCGTSI